LAVDLIAGTAIAKFDSKSCNLLFISMSVKQIFQCEKNLVWNQYTQNNLPTGFKQFAKTDASIFGSGLFFSA